MEFGKQSEKWAEGIQKEQARQVREAAEQVDMLVIDAVVMQAWRKRVRETLDSSRGIKTGEDLLAALADERRNIGAFYTVLAFCHDDMFWGAVAPIITDDIRSLNPQLCSRPWMVGVYYPRQRWMLLDIYLRHVMRDLGVLTHDLGAEGETVQGVADSHKIKHSRREKTPPQILRETRERTVAKLLAKQPDLTCPKLAEMLGCDKSTITRLKAWKRRTVLHGEPQTGMQTRGRDGETYIDGSS